MTFAFISNLNIITAVSYMMLDVALSIYTAFSSWQFGHSCPSLDKPSNALLAFVLLRCVSQGGQN